MAANVANLPLRPPVGLAKQVATLDVLSGGRAELGLGTGAFWDAIVAAGGERRSPKEAVDALVEAIRIIRGVWGQHPDDPGARSVTVRGEHYSVAGMHAGPFPVHPVEICSVPTSHACCGSRPASPTAGCRAWLRRPRRPPRDERRHRRGRRPGRARATGDPADVQRLRQFGTGRGFLRGTADDWAEQLAELTLTEG